MRNTIAIGCGMIVMLAACGTGAGPAPIESWDVQGPAQSESVEELNAAPASIDYYIPYRGTQYEALETASSLLFRTRTISYAWVCEGCTAQQADDMRWRVIETCEQRCVQGSAEYCADPEDERVHCEGCTSIEAVAGRVETGAGEWSSPVACEP